ncbi:hypothetical protein SAMN05660652_02262 [Propionivibrio dicarboxylicus]|uniref:phosphoglycerate kinase n=1 Tax=Propionivibrio dicarboxylicus TaxID=83767 RepID=A0A1G8F1J0_9RHOO|nr:hypothetical protein SAMN05660652_02262 [Propionivibrio dicarboxylicus]
MCCLDEARTVLWSCPADFDEYGSKDTANRGELRGHVQALYQAILRGNLVVVCSEGAKYLPEAHGPNFHLSVGRRAFLEYLERFSLPGITALDPAEQ